MIRILNGDTTAAIFERTGLPEEYFAWREALVEGPTPSGLANDEWVAVRVSYLSEAEGMSRETRGSTLRKQIALLEESLRHQ